jgi:mannose-6-phosphate isomerase
MERVWGGRTLEHAYQRQLPEGGPIGESWEVVDRDAEQSVVVGGPLDGLTLHDLWTRHRSEVFGAHAPDAPRFPLLVKILDARDRLSIQVHPPAAVASELSGEPKTEMWYIAQADPEAALFVGVKPGIDAAAFERAIESGTVEDVVHRIPVRTGDFIVVPSGRVHAIGAGLLIVEIQQNSDTTYRVYDWGRPGIDGKPRALHVEQSLRCIDFSDTAPALGQARDGVLVDCEFFAVREIVLEANRAWRHGVQGEFSILAVVGGEARLGAMPLSTGDVVLVPASLAADARVLQSAGGAKLLSTTF